MIGGVQVGLALGAVVLGLALGPLLDRAAAASLREPDDAVWRPRPILTGAIAGCAGAVSALLVPTLPLLPAWLALSMIGTVIVRADSVRHRIPDVLTMAALATGAVLLVIPGDLQAYGRAWLGALALTAALLLLALIGPSGLGMGDVKLAPTLGLYLGYLGWTPLLVGVMAGFVLAAVVGVLAVIRDAVRGQSVAGALRRALPFGPFLLLGTLVGLLV
jgi:leader peptidase (prepilin peptidase)/N-methyltransferase